MKRSPTAPTERPLPRIELLGQAKSPVDPDGPVGSVQEAEATLPAELLAQLWTSLLPGAARGRLLALPAAGARWACCGSSMTPSSRSVVFLHRRLVLLRFRKAQLRHRARLRPGHLADRARPAGLLPGPRVPADHGAQARAARGRRARLRADPRPLGGAELLSVPARAGAGSPASDPTSTPSTQLRIHVLVDARLPALAGRSWTCRRRRSGRSRMTTERSRCSQAGGEAARRLSRRGRWSPRAASPGRGGPRPCAPSPSASASPATRSKRGRRRGSGPRRAGRRR